MAEQFAPPPVNALISIQPLATSAPGRDAAGVPPQLVNTPPGTLVEGFVVNRDGQSNPILRTVLGDILVKSDVFIKTGSEVVFRVEPAQQGAARIITIDGMNPQDYAATQARGLRTDTITNMADPTQTMNLARSTTIAQPLQAMLINATPPSTALIAATPLLASALTATNPIPAGLLKLQQGAQLKIAILDMQLPTVEKPTQPMQVAANQPNAPAPAPTANTPAPATPAPIAGSQQAPVQPLQTMANANTARIAQAGTVPPAPAAPSPAVPHVATPANAPAVATPVAPQPAATNAVPAQPAPHAPVSPNQAATHSYAHTPQPATQAVPQQVAARSPSMPLPPNALPAVVIGTEKNGEVMVQTQVGLLKLPMPRPVPVGTTLHITLEPITTQPQAPSLPGTLPTGTALIDQMATLSRDWPSLEQAMQWAQSNDPALARQMAQALPTIGPKLTSGMLFFIAAVKGGDMRQFLGGRAIAQLETRAPEIASRLKADMTQLQQLFTESPLPHWQTAMVPLFHNGALEHARLFFRQDNQKEEEKGKGSSGKDQRFIVEVDLSHMGEMQFDGFVRGAQRAKQFDLIIRSSARLPEELLQEIRGTFDTAMQTTGLKGYLAFQQGSQHFVRPLADAPVSRDTGSAQPILA